MQGSELSMLAMGVASSRPPPLTQDQLTSLHTLKDSATMNKAACYAKPGPSQSWQKVFECASTVLQGDPQNAKALYRRGQATLLHGGPGAAEAALQDLTAAAARAPTDASIRQLMQQAQKAIAQQQAADDQKLRAQFAGMFK